MIKKRSHYDIMEEQLRAVGRAREETLDRLMREMWENAFTKHKPKKI